MLKLQHRTTGGTMTTGSRREFERVWQPRGWEIVGGDDHDLNPPAPVEPDPEQIALLEALTPEELGALVDLTPDDIEALSALEEHELAELVADNQED